MRTIFVENQNESDLLVSHHDRLLNTCNFLGFQRFIVVIKNMRSETEIIERLK
jgi:hypothetical protein